MSDETRQIEELSPEKRELLELLLQEQSAPWQAEEYLAPRTPAEEKLAAIWRPILGIGLIGVSDNFFELGGDSIQCIQIVARARKSGLQITTNQLFEHPTIAGLAAVLGASGGSEPDDSPATGPMPLTPIQHWFFEQSLAEPHYWNQAVMLRTRPSTEPSIWAKAVEIIARHHDGLRLRFQQSPAGWTQKIADAGDATEAGAYSHFDFSALPPQEQSQRIEQTAASLQTSLDLASGPLVRFAFFDLGQSAQGRFLIIAHHLAIDGISFRILVEDLEAAYITASRGEMPELTRTASLQRWSRRLVEFAGSKELAEETDWWLEQAKSDWRLPLDFSAGDNTEASARTHSILLTKEETRVLLQAAPAHYRAQTKDFLLATLACALAKWRSSPAVTIDVEGHGREDLFPDVDVSRMIGWFTSLFPIHLDIGRATTVPDALRSVQQQLRQVPRRGIGYGMLRYLATSPVNRAPRPQLVFNYLGQFDNTLSQSALFELASESCGPLYSPADRRPYVLQVHGSVINHRLEMHWTYSANLHRPETIEKLAEHFRAGLLALVTHCHSGHAARLNAGDFPEAELTQDELDRLVRYNHHG